MATLKETAREKLGIKPGNKIIISIDGGGMRGIFTIQLLKRLEALAGSPCYEWCDMVAGTSTGAIISALILDKKNAAQIEELYEQMVTKVFTKRNIVSDRYAFPPAFDKKVYRELVKTTLGDSTLEQLSTASGLDCFFTAKDMSAGEETFFTCIQNGTIKGTYSSVLLRGVVEATMSAPTYFLPFERFIDGGTTTYNNPVMSAVLEALFYDGKGKYQHEELTVFSFGTGTSSQFVKPDKTAHPGGIEVLFWLDYVMEETGKDASEMQVDMLRSGLIKGLDFRRYQLSLDSDAVKKLPDKKITPIPGVDAGWLQELSDEVLENIDMADVTKFPLMKTLGEAVVDFICPPGEENLPMPQRKANWFQKDLVLPGSRRGTLVTAHGNPAAIRSHLSDPAWIDSRRTG